MKEGITKTIKQVNQVRDTELMAVYINKFESEIDESPKELNKINSSINNILER